MRAKRSFGTLWIGRVSIAEGHLDISMKSMNQKTRDRERLARSQGFLGAPQCVSELLCDSSIFVGGVYYCDTDGARDQLSEVNAGSIESRTAQRRRNFSLFVEPVEAGPMAVIL
jgi:hypothetical protein